MQTSFRWAGVAAVLLGLAAVAAADEGKVAMDVVPYKGWQKNLRLSNGDAELIVTLDVGPRVLSYRLKDGKNVFKEYDAQLGKAGEPDWQIRGGHRLWAGPEDLTRTYEPDNGPVKHVPSGNACGFTAEAEPKYGIKKGLVLELAPRGSKVKVRHQLVNVGKDPAELAPWALSVMAPGGVEVIPLPAKKPHPGPPKNARSPKDYAPNQRMVLWPFFDFADPRWFFGNKFILLRQDATRGPTKIGLAHQLGWVGYLNGGTLFVKRFGYDEGKPYPDGGCNFETFTNEDMLEVESLGPLVKLAPGDSVEWAEEWELVGGVPAVVTEADVEKQVLPKVSR